MGRLLSERVDRDAIEDDAIEKDAIDQPFGGGRRRSRRLIAGYAVVIAAIVGSFLLQILQGECPVP